MRIVSLLASLLALLAPAAVHAQIGSIRGTVLSDDGLPVPDAHVYAEVMQGNLIQTVLNANTDCYGMFVFDHLAIGEYRLSAEKQELRYLSTKPDIFGSRPQLPVSLKADAPTVNTVIRFAPQAALLQDG